MKLRFLLTFFLTIVLLSSFAQEKSSVVLESAFKQAKSENKNVLLIFHASWCGWCKRMDANINDETLKEMFDRNFVITHLTVMESEQNKNLENPGAINLFNQHSEGNTGIPFWLVFDENGKVLRKSIDENGKNLGCPASEHEVDVFIDILKETTDFKKDELQKVKDKFLIKDNAG